MSSSERASRVIRGGGNWERLPLSPLAGPHGRRSAVRAGERDRGNELEARIAAAFQEGLAEGRYQAVAENEQREQQAGLSAQQRWSSLLADLAGGIAEVEATMADRLLDLAALLATRIACREILLGRDRIEPVLTEMLKLITGACRDLEVTAHPSDCAAIETWLSPRCGEGRLAIRGDASLTPGGCLLRADDTLLDATVETRVARALAAVGIDARQAGAMAESALADAAMADSARASAALADAALPPAGAGHVGNNPQ